MERGDLFVGRSRHLQRTASCGLHAAGPERADVTHLALQRGHEDGCRDLVLVLEDDDGIFAAEPFDRSEALLEIGARLARPPEQRGLSCELLAEGLDADEEHVRTLGRLHRTRRLAMATRPRRS